MQSSAKVLVMLTVLMLVWCVAIDRVTPRCLYDTNFETFHDVLSVYQRDGICHTARAVVRAAAIPPVVLCVLWTVFGLGALSQKRGTTDAPRSVETPGDPPSSLQ